MRTRLTRVVVTLLTCTALGQAASAAPSLQDRLERTEDRLEDAKDGLETVEEQVDDATAKLQVVDAQLADARAELARVEGELAAAQAAHAQAVAATDQATRRVVTETQRLEQIREQLLAREHLFDARVAATYKYGTGSYAEALVGSRSFTEFLNNYYYVRSALAYDGDLIDQVGELIRQVTATRAEVDALREAAIDHQADADAARAHVEQLVAAQRDATQRVSAEKEHREQVLAGLESSKEEYEALVDSLEAESASIAKKIAEEQRRNRFRAGAPGAGELVWPTSGRAGSGYGYRYHPIWGTQLFHAGVDIAAPTGQTIVAAAEGRVVSAGWYGGYGNATIIDHGGGLATLYAHQSAISVSAGQVVSRGQAIGAVGSTGYSTGPHLHFEVRVNGEPKNPMNWY